MSSVYIDPSELKSSSKLAKCIDGSMPYQPLPGFEERTGADVMISISSAPKPSTDFLLSLQIKRGALLVQLKFGHDLISSLLDGRYKASQQKMIATGAHYTQIVLLFIGVVSEHKNSNELMINGQLARDINPLAKNLTYSHYLTQRSLWAKRGGVFETIATSHKLVVWIESATKAMEECRRYPVRNVWESRQKLVLVDDWRNMLLSLPGLGEVKIMAIYDRLEDKSWHGFEASLKDDTLLDVPGIGSGTIENIKQYLKGNNDKQTIKSST